MESAIQIAINIFGIIVVMLLSLSPKKPESPNVDNIEVIITRKGRRIPDTRLNIIKRNTIRERKRKWNNKIRKYEYHFEEPKWVESKNLTMNHFLGFPINNKEIIYNELIEKSFSYLIKLFPLAVQPRTAIDIKNWKDCLDKLDRIDGYDTRAVYYIVKKVRLDDFWKDNFFSILKLRKKNNDGVKYIDMFKAKFAKDYEFNKK